MENHYSFKYRGVRIKEVRIREVRLNASSGVASRVRVALWVRTSPMTCDFYSVLIEIYQSEGDCEHRDPTGLPAAERLCRGLTCKPVKARVTVITGAPPAGLWLRTGQIGGRHCCDTGLVLTGQLANHQVQRRITN